MYKIEGVEVRVTWEGQPLEIQADGSLGRLGPGKAIINLSVSAKDTYCFFVDGQKKIFPKKNLAETGNGKCYKLRVPVEDDSYSEDGVTITRYPYNNFRLLILFAPEGIAEVWEIALISQGGEFFLTLQKTYQLNLYRDLANRVFIPQLKWPDLTDFVASLLTREEIEKFPLVEEYKEPRQLTARGLKENTGRVLWFNFAMGLGLIKTKKGPARVHWSEISGNGRPAYLKPGQLVQFEALQLPRISTRTSTSVKLEVVGVKVIE